MAIGRITNMRMEAPETHNIHSATGFSQQIVTRKGRIVLEVELDSVDEDFRRSIQDGRTMVHIEPSKLLNTVLQGAKPKQQDTAEPRDAPKQVEEFW